MYSYRDSNKDCQYSRGSEIYTVHVVQSFIIMGHRKSGVICILEIIITNQISPHTVLLTATSSYELRECNI